MRARDSRLFPIKLFVYSALKRPIHKWHFIYSIVQRSSILPLSLPLSSAPLYFVFAYIERGPVLCCLLFSNLITPRVVIDTCIFI